VKLIFIALSVFLMASCDYLHEVGKNIASEYELSDDYPEVEKGLFGVEGTFLSNSYIDDDKPIPIVLSFDNGYRLVANASRYKKRGLMIIPRFIVCGEQKIEAQGKISNAYVSSGFQPVFEIYDSVIMASDCNL
jgi:hypothetical protein